MDKLTITEALIIDLLGRDDVDQTNVIEKLRTAQAKVQALPYATPVDLHRLIDADDTDTILDWVSRGGELDLYS